MGAPHTQSLTQGAHISSIRLILDIQPTDSAQSIHEQGWKTISTGPPQRSLVLTSSTHNCLLRSLERSLKSREAHLKRLDC